MMIIGAPQAARGPAVDMDAPQATRMRRARWRNPQLLAGVLLILVSTVAGIRIVAGADDTVPVLVAARNLSPGLALTDELVDIRQVALRDSGEMYLSGPVGSGYVVQREVTAGDLLPASAVATAEEMAEGAGALRLLALSVPSGEAPAGLGSGDVVDVWLTPGGEGDAELVATSLTVTSAGADGTLGVSGGQTAVTVAVESAGDEPLEVLVARLVAGSRDGRIYLSKLP